MTPRSCALPALLWLVLALRCGRAADGASALLSKPGPWFAGEEAGRATANILSHQAESGGWPKNVSTTAKAYSGKRADLSATYDNGATVGEIRFLARRLRAVPDDTVRASLLRGIDHVLDGQYANGGWPQFHPPGTKYHRHITFNDGVMVRLLELARDIARAEEFAWLDAPRRERAAGAFTRGIDCVLRCQVRQDGQPAVWCAQHDRDTLAPINARAFELASLSGGESAGVALLLMSLENPSAEAREAVRGAALWYRRNRIEGIRLETRKGAGPDGGEDRVVVADPAAPPLWARFYDLRTGKPFFCGRDGVPKAALADIEAERRNGYAWYGTWGQRVLDAYPAWAARHGMPVSLASTRPDELVVAADGSGDFRTVQEAVDAAPTGRGVPFTVRIRPGRYHGRVRVPADRPHLHLRGEDADSTVLTFDLHARIVPPGSRQEVGTGGSHSVRVDADDFLAENLTFANPSGHIAQAVALHLDGRRQAFYGCRVLGGQDTLYLHEGLAHFDHCHIEGRADFIFGGGTALFSECDLRSLNGGYVTAASTPADRPHGLVFLRCRLSGEGAPAWLGRPWQPHAAVAFLHCEMASPLAPGGWHNWGRPENEATARYVEFGNTGHGAAEAQPRVAWARMLSAEEAARYTPDQILGDWRPVRPPPLP